MGHRLHSAKKYDVQYGEASAFNYQSHHVNEIIYVLAEYDMSYDNESIPGAEQLNANREKLIANIDRIVSPDSEWTYQDELDQAVRSFEKACAEVSAQQIHSDLKRIIMQSDPGCDDVHFLWF